MSKQEIIAQFDPNSFSLNDSGIFGLPFTVAEVEVVIVPVPWDATVSYGAGTSNGPEAILEASYQVDLYYPYIKDAWKVGIAMEDVPVEWKDLNRNFRKRAEAAIELLTNGETTESNLELAELIQEVNNQCAELKDWLRSKCLGLMDAGKLVVVLGGDHSTPLGYIEALAQKHGNFGILQIDAHADLRNAFEGFEYSHASIMFNALKIEQVERLVQVGVRDLCQAEADLAANSHGRVIMHLDSDLRKAAYLGENWDQICTRIVNQLPSKVYLSFDIDGLDPKLCPNTGTPVAGGLEFDQAVYLIKKVAESGRTIIGCDLNEVSPKDGDWDANVGARMLFNMCNLMALSNGRV